MTNHCQRPHRRGASEGQQLEALVSGEQVGTVTPAGQDAEGTLGQVRGTRQDLPNDQRTDGGAGGRLQHERAPAAPSTDLDHSPPR
jgi:hypothetical protein